MEQLNMVKDQLMAQVVAQMNHLDTVDAKELGEVIDMIKDIHEAIYYAEKAKYCAEESMNSGSNNYYYTERYYKDVDHGNGQMYYMENPNYTSGNDRKGYYTEGGNGNSSSGMNNHYTERNYPMQFHDSREGRSPSMRKMYMESKESNQDSSKTMRELEIYLQELASDMMELVGKATPDEKAMLVKKMNLLTSKIQNV